VHKNAPFAPGPRHLIAAIEHGRVLAARKLGMLEVPCIELAHLSEAQRRAYIIADNKLALNAGWDEEALKIELGELQLDGFDLSLTGFARSRGRPRRHGSLLTRCWRKESRANPSLEHVHAVRRSTR
jgi:ParB-like chromosome segregation protein Spo0J